MPGPIQFDVRTPQADLTAHVRSALARSDGLFTLPEWAIAPSTETLRIIANGPSSRRAPLDGPTMALNGALKLFTDKGLAPNYWAACDPQPLVADFLRDAPEDTLYLVASKCHPSVLEALRNRFVMLWHVDETSTWELLKDLHPVGTRVSITNTAFQMAERLGWRHFETWGWDGCFMDGASHATGQGQPGNAITMDIGERSFQTLPSWCLEAQNAVNTVLPFHDVKIMGDGMIGAMWDYVR